MKAKAKLRFDLILIWLPVIVAVILIFQINFQGVFLKVDRNGKLISA